VCVFSVTELIISGSRRCLLMKQTKLYKLHLIFVDRCALSVLEYTGGGFGQLRDGAFTEPRAACLCLNCLRHAFRIMIARSK
jgi:hypothetical protein